MSDSVDDAMTAYLDMWHMALKRHYGTIQNFRELIEEESFDLVELSTKDERVELSHRYEKVIQAMVSEYEEIGVPRDIADKRARDTFDKVISGSYLEEE